MINIIKKLLSTRSATNTQTQRQRDKWNREQVFLERWVFADTISQRDHEYQFMIEKGYSLFKSHFLKYGNEDEAFVFAYTSLYPDAAYVIYHHGGSDLIEVEEITESAINDTAQWVASLPAQIRASKHYPFYGICQTRRLGDHEIVYPLY